MLCAAQSRAEAAASCLESKCPHSVGDGGVVGVCSSHAGPVCMTFRSGRGAGWGPPEVLGGPWAWWGGLVLGAAEAAGGVRLSL